MTGMHRILDANVNRAAEGIRVLEDVLRFYFEDEAMTTEFRKMRHKLRKSLLEMDDSFINCRDSQHDIGREISKASTLDKKTSLKQLVNANFKRVTEAIRVLEETLKIVGHYSISKDMEGLRYQAYYLEKEYAKKFKKDIPLGLYGITGEKFANGKSNLQCVQEMIDAGIKIIQYREKEKMYRHKIEEAKQIAKLCHENGVLFIVNDHIDLAVLVDADGVHVGQDDMKISDVRAIIGEEKIVGVSTHSPEQAKKAQEDGADYIGVGPIFKTTTKDTAPVGLGYLEFAVENVDIPFIAIGGIKEHNIEEVLKRGAKRLCLVSEVVGAENIKELVDRINSKL